MIVDQSLTSRPLHMTIEACPEGGWMVYTRQQEADAFVKNTGHIVPLAAFADFDLALRFIREQMAAGPGKPAESISAGPRSYHDEKHHLEAYIDFDDAGAMVRPATIKISLPSDVWVPAAAAHAFGEALMKIADTAQLEVCNQGSKR